MANDTSLSQPEQYQQGSSAGSRDPSNLTSESLTQSQILLGRVADTERRLGMLERDLESLETIVVSLNRRLSALR